MLRSSAELLYYPIHDFEPLMKGLIIGGMGIFHVFLAQFAVGGGWLLLYFQRLAESGRNPAARRFVHGYFQVLVLLSFVLGALTGVGMWFTTIQISPRTIGLMVEEFHWVWAMEWTFFCLEIVSGYFFYRYGARLADRERRTLLLLYSIAAWASLFLVNGILSWQLTPGAWIDSGSIWKGFFNPGFFPSLLYRTAASLTIASLIACVVINLKSGLDASARQSLLHYAARFLLGTLLMPLFGLWYLAVIPDDSRGWVTGGSATMTLFLSLSMGASAVIGVYAAYGLVRNRLPLNTAAALLLVALAFAASAGGEFVREGIRKPYTVRYTLYSNSVPPDALPELRERGCVTDDPYPVLNAESYPNEQLILGAKVFRQLCSVCHTMKGVNGLSDLTETWTEEQLRMNISQLHRLKPFMPPFAGSPRELEALVQLLCWTKELKPGKWVTAEDPAVLARIRQWMEEAGT